MKRSLPLLLIFGGLLTTVFGLRTWIAQTSMSKPTVIHLPSILADLPLARSNTGEQALQEIARLHGRTLEISTARTGTYGAEDQIQLWVAQAPSTPAASQLLAAMASAIVEDRSPFTPLGDRQQGDRMVYELTGFGQLHYYFQSADLLVWLAVDDTRSEETLRQVLEFYP